MTNKQMEIAGAIDEIQQQIKYCLFNNFNNSNKRGWNEGKPQRIMNEEYKGTITRVFDKLLNNNEFTSAEREELNLFKTVLLTAHTSHAFNGRPYNFEQKVENIRDNFYNEVGFRFLDYQSRNKFYVTHSKETVDSCYEDWDNKIKRCLKRPAHLRNI